MEMKRGIVGLALVIFFISFASAEIILTQPLGPYYNLGGSISVPVTIKVLNEVSGVFEMNLICNNTETRFYTTGIKLSPGQEITLVDPNLVLIRSIIGGNKGECKIKAVLGSEYLITDLFKISDKLSISGALEKTEFNAGEGVLIAGKVTRETGENSNGFVEATVLIGNTNLTGGNQQTTQIGTITDGFFSVNISLPTDLKAQNYFIELKAYEKDSEGIITNNGVAQYNIYVKQVPTNLELIFENEEVMPGTPIKINTILHDQTGEPINSTVFVVIKDFEENIVEQKEILLGELFELQIKPTEPPKEWIVYAESSGLTAKKEFKIKENIEADIQIINKTMVVTNIGNVFYNKTILVRVGDSPLNIQVELQVGESRKYVIRAPNGDYSVKISEGDKEVNEMMSLTGKTIGIEEASRFSFGIFFWVLLIAVLGFVGFFFFKKIYKKPFFGRMSPKSFFSRLFHKEQKEKFKSMAVGEDMKMIPKIGNRAELELSIKEGDKQDASIICVRIKDLKEMHSRKNRVSETIEKLMEMAEDKKAVICENQDYLFFILTPARTRTPKNEKTALDLSEKIKYLLEEHNKMFNQKIDFGISLNYGTIIGKQEGNVFKFMSMGSLITSSKKIAHISEGEILLGEKINDLLRLHVRTDKKIKNGTPVFLIKEVKKEADEATKKFISRFMERQKRGD